MLVNYDDGEVIVEQTKGANKVEWKELTSTVSADKITAQPPAEYWTPPGKGNSMSALALAHTDHQAWPIAPRTPAEQRDEPADIRVYVINQTGQHERMNHMEAWLNVAGVPFNRVPAVETGDTKEQSCVLSHISAAKTALEASRAAGTNRENFWCIVLEDDTSPQKDTDMMSDVRDIIHSLPEHIHCVQLHTVQQSLIVNLAGVSDGTGSVEKRGKCVVNARVRSRLPGIRRGHPRAPTYSGLRPFDKTKRSRWKRMGHRNRQRQNGTTAVRMRGILQSGHSSLHAHDRPARGVQRKWDPPADALQQHHPQNTQRTAHESTKPMGPQISPVRGTRTKPRPKRQLQNGRRVPALQHAQPIRIEELR